MVAYTPIYALPSPALGEAPNGPAAFSALATATETALTSVLGVAQSPNLFINPQFSIDQRVASPATFTAGVSGFICDRWKGYSGTGATNVFTRQAGSVLDGFPKWGMDWNRTVAGSATSYMFQRVENVRSISGTSPITVSFTSWQLSGTTDLTITAVQCFGTGGSPSADVVTAGVTTVTVGVGFTRKSLTITLPSIAGKTMGTNGDDYIEVRINRASGQGTGALTMFDMQLSVGSVAPTFVARHPQQELALCQRYYWQWGPYGAFRYIGTGTCISTTNAYVVLTYPVTMRTTPAITFSAANDFSVQIGAGLASSTAMSAANITTDRALIGLTCAPSVAADKACMLTNDQDTTNAAIFVTAEL